MDWEELEAQDVLRRTRAPSAHKRPGNVAIVARFNASADALAWHRTVDRALAVLRLTHSQYWALQNAQWLEDEYSDAMGQWEIAKAARLDPSTTSRIARRLETLGLLDRAPAFGPRMTYRVHVTRAGGELLRRAHPLVTEATEEEKPAD